MADSRLLINITIGCRDLWFEPLRKQELNPLNPLAANRGLNLTPEARQRKRH
jgi:hypothetical protein